MKKKITLFPSGVPGWSCGREELCSKLGKKSKTRLQRALFFINFSFHAHLTKATETALTVICLQDCLQQLFVGLFRSIFCLTTILIVHYSNLHTFYRHFALHLRKKVRLFAVCICTYFGRFRLKYLRWPLEGFDCSLFRSQRAK